VVNIVLNYLLVFGKFGFPEMGIAGSALASTIAEIVAFLVFIGYMIWDKANRKYELLSMHRLAIKDFSNMFRISIPIVFQSILGIGSWFLFFSFIENIGSRRARYFQFASYRLSHPFDTMLGIFRRDQYDGEQFYRQQKTTSSIAAYQ
jgi:Na+-driven multidrug efflux pump